MNKKVVYLEFIMVCLVKLNFLYYFLRLMHFLSLSSIIMLVKTLILNIIALKLIYRLNFLI